LAVLENGGGPEYLSICFFLMYLGMMIGNLAWTKALIPRDRHAPGVALGHLALVLPSLVASYPDIHAALAASFLTAFLSPVSYFSGLFLAYDELEDPSETPSSYASISGWAWFSGLVLGGVMLRIVSIGSLAAIIALMDMALFRLVALPLGIPVLSVLKRAYKEEMGLLPIIEEGIEAVRKAEEEALEWTVASMSRVARGTLFHRPAYVLIGLPKVGIPFGLKVFLAFVGLGLAYPQLVGVQRSLGLDSSQIYMLSALSSLMSSAFYPKAGKGDEMRNLNASLLARSLMLYSVPSVVLGLLSPLSYFIGFMALDGITWSFITVSISRRGLTVSLEYLGRINFVRSLGWSIGALLGGFMANSLGVTPLYVASATLVMVASFVKARGLERAARLSLIAPR